MSILNKIKTRIHIERVNPLEYEVRRVIEDEKITVNNISLNIKAEPYVPKKNDKLYFIPGTSIPRFKIKDFCEKHQVSIVKYKDKADVCFIGPDSYKELLFDSRHYAFRKSDMVSYFENNLRKGVGNHDQFLQDLKDADSTHVTIHYSVQSALKEGKIGQCFNKDVVWHPNIYFKDEKAYESFVSIQTNPNIYDQKEILSRLNSTVMDEASYISVQRMLKSSDKNNVRLAIETMANCDYQKSAVYLLLLMKEYGAQIYEAPNYHHVNFKSLLKFFSINHVRSLYYDDILKALINTKLLNQSNLDMLQPLVLNNSQSIGTSYFKVKAIKAVKRINDALDENILDTDCDTEIHKSTQAPLKFKNIPLLD